MMKFSKASSLYTSSAALVIANLIPLAGALFWDWELFEIVFLYWLESAIIGFFTELRLLKGSFWYFVSSGEPQKHIKRYYEWAWY